MRIVFASHTYFNPYLVVGSHHLARCFATQGHRVFFLSSPVSLAHLVYGFRGSYRRRTSLWLRGGAQHQDGIFEYVPFSPLPRKLLDIARLNDRAHLRCIPPLGWVMRRHGFQSPDVLLVDDPRFAALPKIVSPARLFYRATDLNVEMKEERVSEAERRLTRAARGVIATSIPVLERLRSYSPEVPALLLENGVDFEQFSQEAPLPDEFEKIPPPRAIYVGALDYRFDFQAVQSLAQQQPAVSVVLIGPVSVRFQNFGSGIPNLHYLGPRSHNLIARYLQHSHLGLLPLNDHPANRGRSPMKFYEYAAAGLPVIFRETEELMRRAESFAFAYRSPAELSDLVCRQLQSPWSRAAVQEGASRHCWTAKARKLEQFLGDPLDHREW